MSTNFHNLQKVGVCNSHKPFCVTALQYLVKLDRNFSHIFTAKERHCIILAISLSIFFQISQPWKNHTWRLLLTNFVLLTSVTSLKLSLMLWQQLTHRRNRNQCVAAHYMRDSNSVDSWDIRSNWSGPMTTYRMTFRNTAVTVLLCYFT